MAFSNVYSFGDSLSDAGNVSIATTLIGQEPTSPPYYHHNYGSLSGATFSNGPVWTQDLSQALGLGQQAPSLAGGTNYAYGGAETGSAPQNKGDFVTGALSVPSQISQYGGSKDAASALFTLSVGGNDILDILSNTGLSANTQAQDVTVSVNNEIGDINSLAKDGMKTIVVFNVPNLGLIPQVTFGDANGSNTPSATTDALATSLSQSYNQQLTTQLASLAQTDGFTYHVVDLYGLLTDAVANPSTYGFTNVTLPVWTGNFTDSGSGSLSSTDFNTQNQSLFFDHFHPTAAAHNILANLALVAVQPTYVYQEDLTTQQYSVQTAVAYEGLDTNLHTEFASVTPDNVALFASSAGEFLQANAGNDILVAQSGTNVLSAGRGSSYIVTGSGSDTVYVDATGSSATWNAIQNFHAGDQLGILGYNPNVSKTIWTTGFNNAGATINVDLKGDGSLFASDTFVGVSLAAAQKWTLGTAGTNNSVFTVSA